MSTESDQSVRIARWLQLLKILRAGPIARADLLEQMGKGYAAGDSGRRNLVRDIGHLNDLGIRIEVGEGHPIIYHLIGPLPLFDEEELRTLALIRDRFDGRTQAGRRVRMLLARLTADLTPEERTRYEGRVGSPEEGADGASGS